MTSGRSRSERLAAWFLSRLSAVLLAVFRLLSPRTTTTTLPPITNPLLKTPAVRLAAMIRRREVSSVEVVQAYIDRIQEINPLINAMVKDRFSQALQEAAQADRLIEEETGGGEDVLKDRFPFLGVPVTIKESFWLQGMPNSTGLVCRSQVVSECDAPPVALLKRAGAIPLGVTNIPELCMWSESHNHLYGMTKNPYSLDRTPGGSSGGEGSILGGAGSVMGVGSDIAGSIRMPAFFSGIFGHKPTAGIVSNDGQHPPSDGLQDDFLTSGPMCRYAEDLLPMLRVMAGPDDADRLRLTSAVDVKKLRFFSIPHDGGSPLVSPVDKQLIQAQSRVVECLRSQLGVSVEVLTIPQLRYSFEIWCAMLAAPDKDGKAPTSLSELMTDQKGKKVWLLWEMVKWTLGLSSHTMAAIGFATSELFSTEPTPFLLQQKEALQRRLEDLLGDDGVLLYPSHPHLAPKHHTPLFTPFNFGYTGIFNILGLPVTQVPLGLSVEGLPLGVQVVVGKNQDRLALAVAVYLEKAFGGWREPGEVKA